MPDLSTKQSPPTSNQLRLGVVIPAHNEAHNIEACIKSCEQFTIAGDELIVINAASTDKTLKIAQQTGVKILHHTQHHRGFAVAVGVNAILKLVDVILIAHADMQLAAGSRNAIIKALTENPHAIGGVLGHIIDEPNIKYRIIELGNRFRAKQGQLPYGDQAMFIRTKTIHEIGGFPNMPYMEDLELALRCRSLGNWLYLDKPVRIDARHWRRGVIHTTLRNWKLAVGYRIKRKDRTLDSQAPATELI